MDGVGDYDWLMGGGGDYDVVMGGSEDYDGEMGGGGIYGMMVMRMIMQWWVMVGMMEW